MALTKIVPAGGWDWDGPVASILKVNSTGRIGQHDMSLLVKRAGARSAHWFAEEADRLKVASDVVPVHLIALGAREYYGSNRNGDGFDESELQQSHPTFTKYAQWYRSHKNKPHEGDPAYGQVKFSAYNPEMHRVELLCLLPSTKAAADRMKVLVADRELDKLARDEDLSVSMACRVPYDICSGCGNKARTRDEYCKAASCQYGGCDKNLTRLIKQGNDMHLLHVRNVRPIFFDISDVWRPADRIAYGNRADWIKSAADAYAMGGAMMARDLGVTSPPNRVFGPAEDASLPVKIAYGMASLEDAYVFDKYVAAAFTPEVQPAADLDRMGLTGPEKTAAVAAMAEWKAILPLRDFARLTKRAALDREAAAALPGVFGRMIDDDTLESFVERNEFRPSEKRASATVQTWVAAAAPHYSLDRQSVTLRAIRGSFRTPYVKTGASRHDVSPAGEALARDYAAYQLGALAKISETDNDFVLTCRSLACQNQLS
jgi:hypothetical protein